MLVIAFAYALYSLGFLYVVCKIGQIGCDAVDTFDMGIEQMDWYLYPTEMQKLLPTIINMAQKPVEFIWFGSMDVDRNSFKKVIRIERWPQFLDIYGSFAILDRQ